MPRTHRFLTHLEAVSIHSRGYLPHWEAAGATYSVTFRLHDAIAPLVIKDLLERKHSLERAITSGLRELTSLEAMTIRSEIERRFDVALDRNQGSAHMLEPKIAELVARSITHF